MTIKAGVGMSRHHNPNLAGREAAQQALKKAGVAKADIVIMFASIGYDQRSLLGVVREATGGAPLTGCLAEGTINGEDADSTRACPHRGSQLDGLRHFACALFQGSWLHER